MISYSYIPGTIAGVILLVVLLLLRRRHATLRIDSWLFAFSFIIVTTTAASLPISTRPLYLFYHFLQVVFEMLTGLAFIYGAEALHSSGKLRDRYLLWNAPPMVALTAVYGWYIGAHWVYAVIIAAGIIASVASLRFLPDRRITLLCQLAVWIYGAFLVHQQGHLYDPAIFYIYLRRMTYNMLGFVYLLAAITCLQRLPARSIGKFTIVAGLSIWGGCSILHSWSILHPVYRNIVDQTLDMQKFLIPTGLLLFLLEEQVANTQWLALHDQLTGLANRRLLEDRLPHAIANAHRTRTLLTIFLFDLNGFKKINDSLGHDAGDRLLTHVAAHLKAHLRETDTLARIGGDEFVLVAPNMGELDDIRRFELSIQSIVNTPILLHEQSIGISASIGHALYPDDAGNDAEPQRIAKRLLTIADQRMYALKTAQYRLLNADESADLSQIA